MSSAVKRIASPLIKILVSVGLVWWAIAKLPSGHWPEMMRQLRQADLRWAVAAVGLLLLTQVLCLFRWRALLALQDIHLQRRHVGALGLIGVFFGQFSVGMVGGDLVRVLYTAKHRPHKKPEAMLTVAVDRFFGLAGLCFLALISLPINWNLLSGSGELRVVLWGIGLCLGIGLIVLAGFVALEFPGPHQRLLEWRHALPFAHSRHRFHQGFRLYLREPRCTLFCLGLSLIVHAVSFSAAWAVARSLHLPDPPVTFIFICGMMPIVSLMISLPISIAGFGVRETFCVLFFKSIQLGSAPAWAFSLGWFGVNLALGLIGGLVYLLYKLPADAPEEGAAAS
jgi:uncharacterized protein (TIRG00374 family)